MTDTEWDVIIVGARAAGAGLAMRFARSGRRVLCIEKSSLGSDTLSSHGFGGMAMTQLEQLGVLDDLVAIGAPRLIAFQIHFDGQTIPQPVANARGYTLSIRRTTLDPILVKHALNAGADVRHRVVVKSLLRSNGRVSGVIIEGPDGRVEEHRARLVIGADGRHSHVAGWVNAPIYEAAGTPSSAIYAYYENVEATPGGDSLQYISGDGIDAICGPSDGGVAAILTIFDNARFEEVKRGGVEAYEMCTRSIPVLAGQMRSARLVSKLYPAGPRELDCHFRVPYGPGWALVGDAGSKEHPAAGRGIGNALRCGELLHKAVEAAWSEGKATEAYLPLFHEERDAHMRVSRDFSMMQARVNALRHVSMADIGAAAIKLGALDAAAAAA